MEKTISSACPKCGHIMKSGKMSCCGHGGSWFRNCGSAGNANFDHTWVEGIQACKARSQSKIHIGQQLNVGQQKDIGSSNGTAMIIITPPMSRSTDTPMTHRSASPSITTQGFENLLNIVVGIALSVIIVF